MGRARDGVRLALVAVERRLTPAGIRALVAAGAVGGWYAWGAAPVSAWLVSARPAMEPLSAAELRAAHLDDAVVIARVERLEAAAPIEERWNRVVDGCLSPAQREDALARSAELPPLELTGSVEPELSAVVEAVTARYGPEVSREEPPSARPWTSADRRTRARAVLALARGPGLDPTCVPNVLGATEDLLQAHTDRFNAENELRAMAATGEL